jgi:hypothetical protein
LRSARPTSLTNRHPRSFDGVRSTIAQPQRQIPGVLVFPSAERPLLSVGATDECCLSLVEAEPTAQFEAEMRAGASRAPDLARRRQVSTAQVFHGDWMKSN